MNNGIRQWSTEHVRWQPGRNGLKYAVHGYARVRLAQLVHRHELANIFAISPPKAGSQWLKALLHHSVVRRQTGLLTLPQLDYQQKPPRHGFPVGTFVPGVYLSRLEFNALHKRGPYRAVHLIRDPRDIVVSGYWSAVETHPPTHVAQVEQTRRHLHSLSLEEGLAVCIRAAAPVFRDMASWVGDDDPHIATFRLEDIADDYAGNVRKLLAHCNVVLDDADTRRILQQTSRAALQRRDLDVRGDGRSHYRVQQTSHRDLFSADHYRLFNHVAPGLVEALGYDA